MKKTFAITLVIAILCNTIIFVSAKEAITDNIAPETFTFDEITGITQKNVVKIEIAHSEGTAEPVTISSPILIYRIIRAIKNLGLRKEITGALSPYEMQTEIKFETDDDTDFECTFRMNGIAKINGEEYLCEASLTKVMDKTEEYLDFIEKTACAEWAAENILECSELGFLNGIGLNGLKYPEPITREKFCEIIYNMLDKTMYVEWKDDYSHSFTDTANEKVLSLYPENIIYGKKTNVFAPNDYLTREEAAVILHRVAEYMGFDMLLTDYDESKPYFADMDVISDWALDAVLVVGKMDVMEGISEKEFSPKSPYTAEQAIATVMRLYQLSGKKASGGDITITDKDENVLISAEDITYASSWILRGISPGGATVSYLIEIDITDEAKTKLIEAVHELKGYPKVINNDELNLIIAGEVISGKYSINIKENTNEISVHSPSDFPKYF